MEKLIKMGPIFYITILSGLVTVILSGVTYYQGSQKELAAEAVNQALIEKTSEVVQLQQNLLKQVIGSGAPSLSAYFYPDKKIALFIENDNDFPIYDINLNFPDPDPTESVKKMAGLHRNITWEEMRNEWSYINPFNLAPKTNNNFYNFYLSESMPQTSCFLNISTRNGLFSGLIYIKRNSNSYEYQSEVRDLKGKILNEKKG